MGWETANIHMDSARTQKKIKDDLSRRQPKWLLRAAREMTEAVLADWKIWRKGRRS